jgi:flagellar hook-associated protein 1 FlgK
MTSSLISIASSGAAAASAALAITAQNIANAATEGYVRRGIHLTSLSSTNAFSSAGEISQLGVQVTGVTRNVDSFLQSEARRTSADAARSDTLVSGLTNVDNSLESSGVYTSITSFQTALSQLTANPTDASLRANFLASATTMAQSFNVAHNSMASAVSGLQQSATDGVKQVNQLAQSLAQINKNIVTDSDPSSNNATLLDQRDTILRQLSQYGDITTTLNPDNTVQVQMGGTSGPSLVNGGTASTLAATTAADGTMSLTLGGSALTLTGGSLAGEQQTLVSAATANTTLDTIAKTMMTTVNTAQTNGVDLTGAAGTAMFSGTGAGSMTVAINAASKIATAPAGAAANSLNSSNLSALQSSLSTANVAGLMNDLLFSTSSAVAGATTTQTALDAIASSAKTSLANQSGVSLDTEAANLLQYQQAFQASGKVIQTAETLFNQLLQL